MKPQRTTSAAWSSSRRISRQDAFTGGLKHCAPVVLFALLAVCASAHGGAPVAAGVAIQQHIGDRLPLDVPLRDETGRGVRLGDYFGRRPAILVFGYARCPQLCSVVSNAAVEALRELRSTAGRDFTVLWVSVDPTDSARDLAGLKHRDVGRYGRTGVASGWHYLGGDATALHRLANAAGFYYTYDPRTKLYAHASGFLVLTADGRISQYLLGVDFNAHAVAKALDRAAEGKTGDSVYALLLICARGLGITGRYGRTIWICLEIAVVLTVLIVFGGIGWMFWQERHDRRKHPAPGTSRAWEPAPSIEAPLPEDES